MLDFIKQNNRNNKGFFSSILHSIKNTISGIETSLDPNFSGLFKALSEKNWGTIKKTIRFSTVNKYAHEYNNDLLFLAIEAKEYELARYLLTLENVKNHPTLDSYFPLLVAIAKKDNDALSFILDNIPPNKNKFVPLYLKFTYFSFILIAI